MNLGLKMLDTFLFLLQPAAGLPVISMSHSLLHCSRNTAGYYFSSSAIITEDKKKAQTTTLSSEEQKRADTRPAAPWMPAALLQVEGYKGQVSPTVPT